MPSAPRLRLASVLFLCLSLRSYTIALLPARSTRAFTEMNTKLEKAKALFMDFGGSKFGMGREGAFEEYRQYHVSAKTELEWIKEYQAELLDKLRREPNKSDLVSQFSRAVSSYKNYDALNQLLALIKENSNALCSFSKLRYAEELYRATAAKIKIEAGDVISESRVTAIELMKSVLSSPIFVSPAYKRQAMMKDTLKDESIIQRAQSNLEKMKM